MVGLDHREPVQFPQNQVPACVPLRHRSGHAVAVAAGSQKRGGRAKLSEPAGHGGVAIFSAGLLVLAAVILHNGL